MEDNSILNLAGGNHSMCGGFPERFACAVCGKSYLRKRHLQRHMRDECIGIPPRFSCDLCPSRFRRKYHMVRHLTSKHGIPTAIAQQTTGNRSGSSMSGAAAGLKKDDYSGSVDDLNIGRHSPMPENLTMRKENYEPVHLQQHHLNQLGGGGGSSPSHITSGDSGSDCNGGGTAGTSPIPPAHIMPMPTYGLTGAITAISAAAAHVEEKDAKILLEAAAAAAAAHAAATASMGQANPAACQSAESNNEPHTNGPSPIPQNHPNQEVNENVTNNTQVMPTLKVKGSELISPQHQQQNLSTTTTTGLQNPSVIKNAKLGEMNSTTETNNSTTTTTNHSTISANAIVKAEPLTPTKTAAMNMLDDEWKMKLSLQLISNSLLKERLMNTMPFAYQNN